MVFTGSRERGAELVPPQLLWVLLFSVSIALSSAMMAPSAPPLLLLSLIEHLPRVCHCCFHCGFSLLCHLCCRTFVITNETSVILPSRNSGAFPLLFWREDLSLSLLLTVPWVIPTAALVRLDSQSLLQPTVLSWFPSQRVTLQNKQDNFSAKVLYTLTFFPGYSHQEQAAVKDKLIYTPAAGSQCV